MRLFYDTETTGLWREDLPFDDPSQPRLCQIGLQLYDANWTRTGILTALIKPEGWSIEPEAEKHHGISVARCARHGVPLVAALAVLQAFAASSRQIIAHNNEFDRKVVKAELARLASDGLWWARKAPSFVCTMELSTPVCQLPGEYGFKYPSLEEAHRYLYPGEEFSTRHEAESDVEAVVRVFRGLLERGVVPDPVGVQIAR